jgi:hypothetical protein
VSGVTNGTQLILGCDIEPDPALEQKYVPAVEIPEISPIETRAPAPTRPAASRKKEASSGS